MTVQTRIQLWVPESQIAHFTIWLEIKSRILLENLPLYNIFDQLELQVIISSFKEEGAYCFAAVHRQSVSWSVHPQFPFSFFAEVAHTEMQFCIQIYEEYLGQVGFFAISIHFHFRGLKGRGAYVFHENLLFITCIDIWQLDLMLNMKGVIKKSLQKTGWANKHLALIMYKHYEIFFS